MTTAGAATVRARRPPHEPLRRLNFQERVSPSLWYVPALFVIGAFVLSKVAVAIDKHLAAREAPGWLGGGDAAALIALTSTVAAAMLTFVGVVFTTTLVAIQLAGGQYSPRVVRVFVRSRVTHVTLGLFLATFVFALNALVEIRGGDRPVVPTATATCVYLLLLATLFGFITFVSAMSRMMRVQHLLDRVTRDGRDSLLREFAPDAGEVEVAAPDASPSEVVRTASLSGVVQAIDRAALVGLASARQGRIELLVEAGEYLGRGTPVARVHGATAVTGDEVAGHFLLGAERTLVHDPAFAFRQLVDVAIRALSPAVNDPTTAVQVIDRLNDLLGTVATDPDPSGWYVDERGALRLQQRATSLERLLRLSYVEIIRYGADSPQVVRRLRAAFDVLDGVVRDDVRAVVAELREMLDEAVAGSLPPAFTTVSAAPDRHGFG